MISPVILLWGFPLGPVVLATATTVVVLPTLFRLCAAAAAWFDRRTAWHRGLVVVVALGCFFAVELLIGYAVRVLPDWDAGTIYSNAAGLATGSMRTIDADYYSMYPNNIVLTLLLAGYLSVLHQLGATDLYLGGIALNALAMTTAVFLTLVAARKMAGTASAVFALLPCTAFIALSPWIAVPYSDTLGMVFPVLLLLLFLQSREAKKPVYVYGLWVAMGLVSAVGFSIKPTVVFVLIAAAAVLVFTKKNALSRSRHASVVIGCLLLAFGAFGVGSATIKAAVAGSGTLSFNVNTNDKEFPVTHFLKMGAVGFGGFNGPDVVETKSINSVEGRFQNGLDVYRERVSAMGPWGYLAFLDIKGKAILGDGTFFTWGEGMARQPVELVARDPVSKAVQDYFYYDGPHFAFLRAFWQSLWFATLLLVAAPLLIRGRSLVQPAAIVMRLALFALLLFLLLFEGRSRYLYMYVPFFILLAALTAGTMARRFAGRPAEPAHTSGEENAGSDLRGGAGTSAGRAPGPHARPDQAAFIAAPH
ncbi:hypothetical protein VUN84_12525 [Micrococcaceae bacterium Sec5.8]